MADSTLVEICALWKQESKAGDMYLSGTLNRNTKILVLKNGFKEKENEPDYRVHVAPKPKQADGDMGSGSVPDDGTF